MNNAKLWLLASLITLTGCKDGPIIETCIIGDTGLQCVDKRLPEAERSYTRTFEESLNYFATNPDDLEELLIYCKSNGDKL
jgi:hypothetical protein